MIYTERMLMSVTAPRDVSVRYRQVYSESTDGRTSPVLRVKLRAITANKVTRNRTFYPIEELEGDGVSKGYITAIKPYPIPILLDHRTTSNAQVSAEMPLPVGRAVDARVVRKGRGRKEGYLEIDALIYDRRVMEMIMDTRFLTVSVGQIPDRVQCSVCGADVDGYECPNGHARGGTYEWNGEIRSCYHIMRGIELVEVSFVNVPSDSDAVVLSKSLESGTITAGGLEMMDLTSIMGSERGHEGSTDALPAESASVVNESVTEADTEVVGEVQAESLSPVLQAEEACEDVPSVEDDGDDSEVPASELYLIDGALPFPEARLTAAQRKRLPDSAFCGPNRSFPAHDKPHVLAGLRLLGRAKLSPAQKARVRACLLRKARQLGMKTGQDGEGTLFFWVFPQSALDVVELSLDSLPRCAGRVVLSWEGTVLLEVSDEEFARIGATPDATPESLPESATDEIAELRHTIEQMEMELREWVERAQRAETRLKQIEHELLVNQAVEAALAVGYPPAVGRTTDELKEYFGSRSDEFLRTLVEDLRSSPVQQVANRLDDVRDPLAGIEVGAAEGIHHVVVQSDQQKDVPTRYNAVEELISALRRGAVSVQESEEEEAEVYRVIF